MFEPLPFELNLTTQWLGHPFYYLTETGSTNRLIRTLSPEVAPPGTVLLADHQTSGRGRRERQWNSPPAQGLLFSLLLPPPARLVPLVPHITAIGIARAYESEMGIAPLVKWPNDLLIDECKCGGILLESEWSAGQLRQLIVGIGLNVNQAPEDFSALPHATSLRAVTGKTVERGTLLGAILRELESVYDAFAAGWLPHEEWSRRAKIEGMPLWIHPDGGTPWRATALRLGENGELVVKNNEGNTITLLSGDVSVRRAQPEFQS